MAWMNEQWQKVQRSDYVQEYFMVGQFIQSDNWERSSPPNFSPNNYPYLKDCIEFCGNKYGRDIKNEIRVTEITHGTSCENMLSIRKHGGFIPNTKDIPGIGNMGLVWFGVKISETETDCVKEKYKWSAKGLLEHGLSLSTVDSVTSHFACTAPFQPMSRYGNFKFTFSIGNVLQEYEDQFCKSFGWLDMRMLGTFAYKMETMHVILVCPPCTMGTDLCPPLLKGCSIIQPDDEHCKTWIWRPHSTGDQRVELKQSGFASLKRWEHVAFAFYVPNGHCLKICNLDNHLSLCVWQHMNRTVSNVNAAISNMLELMASEEIFERKSLANMLIRMIRGYIDERPLYHKTIKKEFLLHQVDLSIDIGWVSGKIGDLLQIRITHLDWSPLIDWIHSVTGLTNLPDFFKNLQN